MGCANLAWPLLCTLVLGACSENAREESMVYADDIAIAHTPDCGWSSFPPPVLAQCTEPLVAEAPDLRGIWAPIDGPQARIERIEQCGDRVVISGGGVTHDMRADGTLENGVDDVSFLGCTPIRVRAEFVDGALVLRPENLPITVTRFLDGQVLVVEHPLAGGRFRRIEALPDP